MREKAATPAIRFKGFTDAWEQRKLGEVFNFHYGDGNNNPSNGGQYPVFGAGGIQGRYTKYNAENSIIIGHMGDAGCVSWGEGKHFVTYNGTITTPKDDVFTAKFGYYLLLNMNLRKYRGGSGLPFLTYDMLTEMETKCPNSKIETQEIADYFSQLDNLITLHQRKYDKLTNVKKSMLEKMFPKNGSNVPEIRFKGFTDAWEQRKLGDIGETYTGLSGKTKADFGHGQARFVTYMNVFSNPISNPEMTEPIEIDPKQNEVEVGDVLFTTSSETPEEVGMSSVLLEKRGKTYLNSFCFGFRPSEKIDSYYLAYMLRSESAREKIILLAQGISRYNISKNKVMEIAVSLPSLDEQKLIGQYFRQLDHLITLHQRELEKLQNIKKSMLEKMFV